MPITTALNRNKTLEILITGLVKLYKLWVCKTAIVSITMYYTITADRT